MPANLPSDFQKPTTRDRSGENFKKRWRTFVRSGFKVHQDYNADVYILLRRQGRVFEFKSTGNAWPLPHEDIVRCPQVLEAVLVGDSLIASLQ